MNAPPPSIMHARGAAIDPRRLRGDRAAAAPASNHHAPPAALPRRPGGAGVAHHTLFGGPAGRALRRLCGGGAAPRRRAAGERASWRVGRPAGRRRVCVPHATGQASMSQRVPCTLKRPPRAGPGRGGGDRADPHAAAQRPAPGPGGARHRPGARRARPRGARCACACPLRLLCLLRALALASAPAGAGVFSRLSHTSHVPVHPSALHPSPLQYYLLRTDPHGTVVAKSGTDFRDLTGGRGAVPRAPFSARRRRSRVPRSASSAARRLQPPAAGPRFQRL